MDYTENGATLQELPEKSPISGKRKKKLLEIERRASKKTKKFSKTTRVDEPESSLQSKQGEPE